MDSIISIIMPVYNTEEYLERSIQSILNQTYKQIELIIINDGSTDKSQKIITSYSKIDNRIKMYNSNKRKGVGASRNYGVQNSTGEYIYFFDSDDYLPTHTLEYLARNIGDSEMIRGRMRTTNLSDSFSIVFEGLFKTRDFTENKYELLRHNSAVNFLIKKSYIDKQNLTFDETVDVYSDLNFMVPALINIRTVPFLREAIYFRRRRNDPVSNPSLTQLSLKIKLHDFITAYNKLKNSYVDAEANAFLDRHFLNIYRKDAITFFKKSDKRIDEIYEQLSEAIKKINPNILKEYDWVLRKEISTLQEGDIKQYKKVNKRHSLLRDIREGLQSKRAFMILLYNRVFSKLPIKEDLIFFESFLGKSYSDSPKYIYQYMIENRMPYTYVWCLEEEKDIPGNAINVRRFSFRYYYYLARAKYWVSNSRLPIFLEKREDNIYLQTWHGTPLKKLVFDMDDIHSADPNYKNNFYMQSRRWDYLSSPNQYSSDIFRTAFKYDGEMLEFGYPRNDILYTKNTKENIEEIKTQLGLPLDKKTLLYAPTWRDDQFYSRGKYKFTLNLELDKMQQELDDDYIILLRTHYFIADQLDVSEYKGFVYDFSSYDDIAELYLVTDILITDYSSVFFDFANLQRPILFFTYDLETYRDKLRGFYLNIEKEVPGPLLMDTNEVIYSVKNIDKVSLDFQDKYEVFYNKFCKWDNGKASEETVKEVFKK